MVRFLLGVAAVLALGGVAVALFAPRGIDTDLRGFSLAFFIVAALFGVFGAVEWSRLRRTPGRPPRTR